MDESKPTDEEKRPRRQSLGFTETIQFRVSPGLLRAARTEARASCEPLGQWIRRLMIKELNYSEPVPIVDKDDDLPPL